MSQNFRGRALCRWCAALHERLQIADRSRAGDLALVKRDVELLLDRGHQLDAFQGAEAQLVDRGLACHAISMCELGDDRRDSPLARGSGPFGRRTSCLRPVRLDAVARQRPAQVIGTVFNDARMPSGFVAKPLREAEW
jgi:hypothetical protein